MLQFMFPKPIIQNLCSLRSNKPQKRAPRARGKKAQKRVPNEWAALDPLQGAKVGALGFSAPRRGQGALF